MRETVRYLFDAPMWVSWLAHSALMLLIAAIAAEIILHSSSFMARPLSRRVATQVGLIAGATSYVVAEIRHVIWKWVTAVPIDGPGWVDHVMDALVPTLVAAGLVWVLGKRESR